MGGRGHIFDPDKRNSKGFLSRVHSPGATGLLVPGLMELEYAKMRVACHPLPPGPRSSISPRFSAVFGTPTIAFFIRNIFEHKSFAEIVSHLVAGMMGVEIPAE